MLTPNPVDRFDVAIVGAGPAGLIAATILAANSSKRIVVLDKGNEIDRREGGPESRAWVEGIGGAGLFSDGKLCMSLDVGGHLRDELPKAEKDRLLRTLDALFRRALGEAPMTLAASRTNRRTKFDNEITVTSYPVLHIGTDRGGDVIHAIVAAVRRLGVEVRSGSEVVEVMPRAEGGWKLRAARRPETIYEVHAESLILAMGKVGAQQQSTFCEQHGASLTSVPMYIGVRLECDSEPLESLFSSAHDPKIKLHFSDGTKIKTHCATMNGEIAALRYEGLPLAGGHAYTNRKSGRSGFAILWDGIRRSNNFEYARELMTAISHETNGRLMAQRLIDYFRDRASTSDEIRVAHPSFDEWGTGNIRDFLPKSFTQKLDTFLRVLEADIPTLKDSNGILIAPAIEWWMHRVAADPRSMRSSAGIYVCGDGSGWSQGIVHAAATGIIAAEDLLHVKVSPQELVKHMFAA
jgi:uncharacterized FAD-dependent dehydrogenase